MIRIVIAAALAGSAVSLLPAEARACSCIGRDGVIYPRMTNNVIPANGWVIGFTLLEPNITAVYADDPRSPIPGNVVNLGPAGGSSALAFIPRDPWEPGRLVDLTWPGGQVISFTATTTADTTPPEQGAIEISAELTQVIRDDSAGTCASPSQMGSVWRELEITRTGQTRDDTTPAELLFEELYIYEEGSPRPATPFFIGSSFFVFNRTPCGGFQSCSSEDRSQLVYEPNDRICVERVIRDGAGNESPSTIACTTVGATRGIIRADFSCTTATEEDVEDIAIDDPSCNCTSSGDRAMSWTVLVALALVLRRARRD